LQLHGGSLLLALTEQINSDQQRKQQKQPCRKVDKIVVLHAYHPLSFVSQKAGGAAVQVLLTTPTEYHMMDKKTRTLQ